MPMIYGLLFLLMWARSSSAPHPPSPCPDIFSYEGAEPENNRWYGEISLRTDESLVGIRLDIELDRPSDLMVSWMGDITTEDNVKFTVLNLNGKLRPGPPVLSRIMVKFNRSTGSPKVRFIRLNGRKICPEDSSYVAEYEESTPRPQKPQSTRRPDPEFGESYGESGDEYPVNGNNNNNYNNRPNSQPNNNFNYNNNNERPNSQSNNNYDNERPNSQPSSNYNNNNNNNAPGNAEYSSSSVSNVRPVYKPPSPTTQEPQYTTKKSIKGTTSTTSRYEANRPVNNNNNNNNNVNGLHSGPNTVSLQASSTDSNADINGVINGLLHNNQSPNKTVIITVIENGPPNRPVGNGGVNGNGNNGGGNSNSNSNSGGGNGNGIGGGGNGNGNSVGGNGNGNSVGGNGIGGGGSGSGVNRPVPVENNNGPSRPNANSNQQTSTRPNNQGGSGGVSYPSNTGNSQQLSSGSGTCGEVKLAVPLVTAGQSTHRGQWPWHVALYLIEGINLSYHCGGSLVSKNKVITAAHCVTNKQTDAVINSTKIVIYLGKYHQLQYSDELGVQTKQVIRINVYPNYNSSNYLGDIAVLTLSSDAELTNYVTPVCLWDEKSDNLNDIVDKEGTVVGWGFDENDTPTEELKMAKMPVVSHQTCLWSYPQFYSEFTSDKTFCAGFRNGTSVCNGDSGGGMVFSRNSRWYLRGIVSITVAKEGLRVCDTRHYVVFTDVAKYLDFIKKNLR